MGIELERLPSGRERSWRESATEENVVTLVPGPARSALRRAESPAGEPGRIVMLPPEEVPVGARVIGVLVALDPAGAAAVEEGRRGGAATTQAAALRRSVDAAAPERLVPRPGLLIDRAGRRVVRDGEELALTRREFDLLEFLAGRPGRVLTRANLLAAVWGHPDPQYAGLRTVDVHVARVRRKLGRHHASALEALRGVGYRWVP